MKILITGANGYLGQGIVNQLIADGNEVVAVDVASTHINPKAQIFECDMFSISNPYEYFGRPDVLLHLAWRNGFVHNALSHIEDLPFHYKFLKSFVDSGISKIAVLGTMHEVGFYEGSIDENTETHPQSLYGIAKDALRNALKVMTASTNIITQWIRGFYIVGNSEYGSSIFSKITAAEKEGKTEFPFTSGQNQWDFIDYPEFCYCVAKIIEQDRVSGIINVCSGYPEKLAERVERFIRDNKYKIKLAYGKFPDRPYDSKAVWGNDRKLKQVLSSVNVENE